MLQYQISDVVDTSQLVTHVTIVGKLIPVNNKNYMKLVRLAYEFRKSVLYATRMIAKELPTNAILRELRAILNKAYGDSAYKVAKAIVEACRFNGGYPHSRHDRVGPERHAPLARPREKNREQYKQLFCISEVVSNG